MSLLRLLTAGKSLVGLSDNQSRYVARDGLLPKFGSKKNPFRATTIPTEQVSLAEKDPSIDGTVMPPAPATATGTQADSTCAPVGARESQQSAGPEAGSFPSPAGVPTSASSSQFQTKRSGTSASGSSRWARFWFWQKPKPAKTAAMPVGRSLLQGELSLDGVKVMRNDLSDSDLEVVRIKPPAPAPAAKPKTSDLPKASPTETTWSRVTGRFFGAGKT